MCTTADMLSLNGRLQLFTHKGIAMQIRNRLLTLWREDVSRLVSSQAPICHLSWEVYCWATSASEKNTAGSCWQDSIVSRSLSAEQAEVAVPLEMRQYARVAWTFLNNAGYINFGVAPAIAQEALGTPQTKGSVIVIGAGMAGERPVPSHQLFRSQRDFPCDVTLVVEAAS